MQRVVVFLGPSLPLLEAERILPATYLPPARTGDIYSRLSSDVDAFVFIDGIVSDLVGVTKAEILAAIDEGIPVLGASGLGAVLAADLVGFGVEGHGSIYDGYCSGEIDGNDEIFGATPLVNIRATLKLALSQAVISSDEEQALLDVAKRTYYPDRSFERLFESPAFGAWSLGRQRALKTFVEGRALDAKRQDAISALQRAAQGLDRPSESAKVMEDYAENTKERLSHTRWNVDGREVRGSVLFDALGRSPGLLAPWRDVLVERWFLGAWAEQRRVTCPPSVAEGHRARHQAHHVRGSLATWLRDNALTPRTYEAQLGRGALAEWLVTEGGAAFDLAPSAGATPFLVDWARSQGIVPPATVQDDPAFARWMVVQGPDGFGMRDPWDLENELLRHLQFTNAIPTLARRIFP